jgi:transposase
VAGVQGRASRRFPVQRILRALPSLASAPGAVDAPDPQLGERLFIDYAGQTVGITDGSTGEIREAQIFVAVLGASNYTYLEATWSQQLPDWIGSHVRALDFFGGCTELWVPDNLRSGVSKASRYEPDLNPTYHDLAEHYGVAVLPARARRPKDKAKVENGVLVVTRWVLGRLRHQRFFSLNELNRSLRTLLLDLNQRPFKKLPGCRASAFAEMDQPALRPLPQQRYEYAEWKVARVGVDYHVEIDGHYYSVPCQHARVQVDVRVTKATVEIFQRGQRIASHALLHLQGTAYDDRRAHARSAPRSRWLERRHADHAGRRHWTALRGAGRANAAPAAPSPASVPQLPWRAVAGPAIRRRASGGRVRPCTQAQRRELEECAGHPQERPRPAAAGRAARREKRSAAAGRNRLRPQ